MSLSGRPVRDALALTVDLERGKGLRSLSGSTDYSLLQPRARSALGGPLLAAVALGVGGVLNGVALVEDDDSIEVAIQPIDDRPASLSLS
jgi:hypothetical protein